MIRRIVRKSMVWWKHGKHQQDGRVVRDVTQRREPLELVSLGKRKRR